MIASGLPNTKEEKEVVMIRALSKIGEVIQQGKCASFADTNGSITAWMDDSGLYRCEANRFLVTTESKVFYALKDVRGWYKKWLNKIK